MINRDLTELSSEAADRASLQSAASKGLSREVLDLLSRGVYVNGPNNTTKTPFYLAVAAGHYFIAKILLAAGASVSKALKQVKINRQPELAPIIKGLVKNNDFLFISFYLLKIQCNDYDFIAYHLKLAIQDYPAFQNYLGAFLEFATQLNHAEIRDFLIELSPPRHENANLTAAYWQATHGNEIEAVLPLLKTEQDWLVTLRQFYTNNKALFHNYFRVAHPSVRAKFSLNKDTEISGLQSVIYDAAAKNDLDNLEIYCDSADYFYSTLSIAFAKKNFVALNSLLALNQFTPPWLRLMQDKNEDLLTYLIVNTKADLYEIALAITAEPGFLQTFIAQYWSVPALQKILIERGMKRNDRINDAMVNLIKEAKALDRLGFATQLIHSINWHYSMNLQNIEYLVSDNSIHVKVNETLCQKAFKLISIRFSRFRMTVENTVANVDQPSMVLNIDRTPLVPDAIWHKIFSYLFAQQQQEQLPTLNQFFHNLLLYKPTDAAAVAREAAEREQIEILGQIRAMQADEIIFQRFMDLIDVENLFQTGRFRMNVAALFTFILTIMSICMYFLNDVFTKINGITDHLKNDIIIFNTTCEKLGPYNEVCGVEARRHANCKDLCNDITERSQAIFGLMSGIVVPPLVGLVVLCILHELYYSRTFASVSQEVKDAQPLQRGNNRQAYDWITPGAEVLLIQDKTRTLLQETIAARAALEAKVNPGAVETSLHIEEIKDEDDVELTINSDEEDLLLPRVSSFSFLNRNNSNAVSSETELMRLRR